MYDSLGTASVRLPNKPPIATAPRAFGFKQCVSRSVLIYRIFLIVADREHATIVASQEPAILIHLPLPSVRLVAVIGAKPNCIVILQRVVDHLI